MSILEDFAGLFFPRLCISCSDALFRHESMLCDRCLYHLPRTSFHRDQENPVARLFWGRVKIEQATSFFYFTKGSPYQKILHELKYEGMKEIGLEMGKIFGREICESAFGMVELIVPIPLHRSRQRKRGYNQSEWIAMGLAEGLKKPMDSSSLVRKVASSTQTRKGRYDRWTNVEGIFRVIAPDKLESKHILLVDDVVTTGATLEACASEILMLANTRVSIATLAVA